MPGLTFARMAPGTLVGVVRRMVCDCVVTVVEPSAEVVIGFCMDREIIRLEFGY